MKIAIIDDERPARSELQYLLSAVLPEAEYFEADSADSADKLMREERFQVVFLDINLGDVRGTVLASTLKKTQPNVGIVFVTAYQEYAVTAFELEAVDYILKPFDLTRIEKTIQRLKTLGYLKDNEQEEQQKQQKQDAADEKQFNDLDKIAVNAGDKIKLINISDIVFIEASQRNILIHTLSETFVENFTMSYLEEKLEQKEFYRIHKSYLVNLKYVEELIPTYNNGYAMRMQGYADTLLPISRNQIKNIRQFFRF